MRRRKPLPPMREPDSTAEEVNRSLHKAEHALRTAERSLGRLRRPLTKAERRKLNTLRFAASQLRKLLAHLHSHERHTTPKVHIRPPATNITGTRTKGFGFVANDDPRMYMWDGTKFWLLTKLGKDKREVYVAVERPVLDLLKKVLSAWEFRTIVARGDGRSWDDLADVTGLSPSTLREYERRARAKVERLMKSGELQAAIKAASEAYPQMRRIRKALNEDWDEQ